ncbi:hypothetical protein IA854_13595 [Listeria seeligeri]|uniref:hypothetical protein n=2 Tax=Listeria seeligeri TaxID=1640 RepID=UPI0016238E97|nr:hypothetical protein [Listeria seeligeri]MBC1990362.1 hypothetical protein [Listeria seeligeri]MBF2356008.1 hypothetical protein [Listeria seeligeri]MBF2375176.1 hypothetical protein [Listeria seeligeri]
MMNQNTYDEKIQLIVAGDSSWFKSGGIKVLINGMDFCLCLNSIGNEPFILVYEEQTGMKVVAYQLNILELLALENEKTRIEIFDKVVVSNIEACILEEGIRKYKKRLRKKKKEMEKLLGRKPKLVWL